MIVDFFLFDIEYKSAKLHTLPIKGGVMWEIEIISERQNKDKLQFILRNIEDCIQKTKAVTSIMGDERRIYFSIGVGDNGELELKSRLRLALCDVFCLEFKYEFLQENLNFDYQDETTQILEKLCTYFDRETERVMVLSMLELSAPKIDIDSFYQFRLRGLRQKWKEFCDLINDNISTIRKGENTQDFVQFLLGGINNMCQSVILDLSEKCLVYKDEVSGFDVLEEINPSKKNMVLVKLVELNPQKIAIKNVGKYRELIDFLKSIFKNRICFLSKY